MAYLTYLTRLILVCRFAEPHPIVDVNFYGDEVVIMSLETGCSKLFFWTPEGCVHKYAHNCHHFLELCLLHLKTWRRFEKRYFTPPSSFGGRLGNDFSVQLRERNSDLMLGHAWHNVTDDFSIGCSGFSCCRAGERLIGPIGSLRYFMFGSCVVLPFLNRYCNRGLHHAFQRGSRNVTWLVA